jgi:replicative DNA helicase
VEQPLVDLATERAVLAGIATYGSNGYNEVADILTATAFTDEFNQIVFRCCEYLLKDANNAQVDLASILAAATSLGYSQVMLGRPDERKLLRSILNFPIHQSNIRNMALRLAKLEVARRLKREIHSAGKLLDSITGDEPIDHIISLAENPIFELTTELSTSQSSGPIKLGEGVRAYIDYLAANPCQMVGISTGYPNYDLSIGGGLRKGTVNLIGARPKIGKTTFGDNVGIHIATILDTPVLNIDTEMSKEDHRVRILANLSEVPIQDIETGAFTENSWKRDRVNKAIDKFEKIPYYYESVAGKAFDEIVAMMRRWVHRVPGDGKPCVIIYDYLKVMDYEGFSKNMQEYQLLGFQISNLHNFMVRHEEARCLSFIQLNRDGISREDTDVASGSDRQIWLCDNFSIFKKKSDEELAEDNTANRKMVQLITRHGAGLEDGDYINMQFKGQYNKIVEGKTRNQVKADKRKQIEGFVVNDAKPEQQIPFN